MRTAGLSLPFLNLTKHRKSMAKLIRSRTGRWFTSWFFFMVAFATLFFALSNRSGEVAAAPSVVTPTVLHFHGNPTDDAPCTGDGAADVDACGGPKLLSRATLGTGPAAHWDPEVAAGGVQGQNIYDPNWIWTFTGPTTLSGEMTVTWWASCGACGFVNG